MALDRLGNSRESAVVTLSLMALPSLLRHRPLSSLRRLRDQGASWAFDGLLMFAAADVYASEEALENIFPHLRENARVAAFGAKLSSKGLGSSLNPVLRMLFNLSFSTTPRPDYEPWRSLAKRVEKLDVEEYFFGLMFLCSGSVYR